MSKYKVGDKVVMEIGKKIEVMGKKGNDVISAEPLSAYTEPLEAKIRRQAAEITRLLAKNKGLKEDFEKSKRVTINMGRLAGQNEAWELARKISLSEIYDGYSNNELKEIFDSICLDKIFNSTYQEAAAKVAEWEKAKDEIKIGDILEYIYDSNVKCVATNLYPNNRAYLVFEDGTAGMHELDNFKQTGRNMDIDNFLKQIRGEKE